MSLSTHCLQSARSVTARNWTM